MNNPNDIDDLIRAWKDEDRREELPGVVHPSGDIDLTMISGGDVHTGKFARSTWLLSGPLCATVSFAAGCW
ncbi:hypothetical protein [Embleya sp. NPDC050493]|uniref:hypothetical protein n=1 Tax=Embleya sp. NPDC050493 TaxID=3363989 RepID=UPI00379382A3